MLILDEPANGLDPRARIEMRELLLRLAAMGKTLIVTSHILPELARICNVVAMITQGKLRAFGTLDQIMRDIRQRRTFEIQLVDASQLNAAAECVARGLDEAESKSVEKSDAELMVRFQTSRSDKDLAGLLARLVDQRVAVGQFREVPTDLEDAFLSVTSQT
jgi:ABC-2 type transport system ATP-binding protein